MFSIVQVEVSRISGTFPQDRTCEAGSECSGDSGRDDECVHGSSTVTCRVSILSLQFYNS